MHHADPTIRCTPSHFPRYADKSLEKSNRSLTGNDP
jgi:hypothetical protein